MLGEDSSSTLLNNLKKTLLDLSVVKPTLIRFEHLHMSTDQYNELMQRLIKHGYTFIADKMNTTAFINTPPF